MRPSLSRSFRLLVTVSLFAGTLGLSPAASALQIGSGAILWGNANSGADVPVCYTSQLAQQPGFARFLSVAQNSVMQTWGREANIRFTGWGQCPATPSPGMVVMEYERCRFNAWVGRFTDVPSTITIDFNNTDSDGSCNSGDNTGDARWSFAFAHEMGHVLGFGHEMDRSDNPFYADPTTANTTGCKNGAVNDGSFVTPFDRQSIMDNCGRTATFDLQRRGWVADLSAWDIIGAIAVYGKIPDHQIIGDRGLAVGASSTGSNITMMEKNTTILTSWIDRADGSLWNPSYHFVRMHDQIDSAGNGTMVLASRGGTPLKFDQMQWIMMGNMCVTANSPSTHELLTVQPCNAGIGYQRWDPQPDGRIKLHGTEMCVNVPWGSAVAGNVLQIYPCHTPAADNEMFIKTSTAIMWKSLCFNIAWGQPIPGSALQLYDCNGGEYNDIYHFRGNIRDGSRYILSGSPVTSIDAPPGFSDDQFARILLDRWY